MKAYQIFDYVLVILILTGTRVGPFLLLVQTIVLLLLQSAANPAVFVASLASVG